MATASRASITHCPHRGPLEFVISDPRLNSLNFFRLHCNEKNIILSEGQKTNHCQFCYRILVSRKKCLQ